VLKWATENGCRWDSQTCVEAAGRGDLEMLKWARERMSLGFRNNKCRSTWLSSLCLEVVVGE